MKTWKLVLVLVLVLVLLAALAAGGLLMASQQSETGTQEDVEDFVPTEKVPAGGAVAFPVDI